MFHIYTQVRIVLTFEANTEAFSRGSREQGERKIYFRGTMYKHLVEKSNIWEWVRTFVVEKVDTLYQRYKYPILLVFSRPLT